MGVSPVRTGTFGGRAFVHGVDDLGVVDPARVGGRGAEIGVTELPLDDQ